MTVTLSTNLLAPAAVLVLWSLIVLIWLLVLRIPAIKAANIPPEQTVGGRGQDLDRILPARVNWPAHNYAHLMEQPTIFYTTVIILALLGRGTAWNLTLAWSYVVLRVIHSLWQIRVNTIPARASLFSASSMILLLMAADALRAALAV